MTLVLKSNVKLKTDNLSDKIDLKPIAVADFVGEQYFINGSSVAIEDVISVSNNRFAGKYDSLGNYSEVKPASTPVISSLPTTLKKGLLVDSPKSNFFIDGKTAPKSFSRLISLGNNQKLVLSVWGAGSARLFIEEVLVGEATEEDPLFYQIEESNLSVNLRVEVVGHLNQATMIKTVDARMPISRSSTEAAVPSDRVSIQKELLNSRLADMEGCLVFKNSFPESVYNLEGITVQTLLIAQIVDSTSGNEARGISVAFRENDPTRQYFLRGFDTAERSAIAPLGEFEPLRRTNTFAINFSNSGATLAVNGRVIRSVAISPVTLDTVRIASGVWGVTTTQVLEYAKLYDRQLTDEELVKVTE